MSDRDFKKWKPFNSVVPARELLKKERSIDLPELTEEQLERFEEKLKSSMYLKSKLKIIYIENNEFKSIEDYVVKLDPLKKNIYFKNKKINFRQIYDIK